MKRNVQRGCKHLFSFIVFKVTKAEIVTFAAVSSNVNTLDKLALSIWCLVQAEWFVIPLTVFVPRKHTASLCLLYPHLIHSSFKTNFKWHLILHKRILSWKLRSISTKHWKHDTKSGVCRQRFIEWDVIPSNNLNLKSSREENIKFMLWKFIWFELWMEI